MGGAPTVEMDGRIIEEAILPQLLSACYKAVKSSSPVRERASDTVYSLDDEVEIARRLADLGYL